MREGVRVVVLGTGQMGSGVVRLLVEKRGLELVGVYARRPARSGMDAEEIDGFGCSPCPEHARSEEPN